MPALILPLIEAAAHWPERGALIGLDLGTKTIGVAVSDPDRRLATGVETIQRKAFKADAARVLALADERSAVGFVLGLPINMDGSVLGRAAFDRSRRARADRHGCQPCQTRRGDRRARRDVHSTGRARSVDKTARGSLTIAVVIGAPLLAQIITLQTILAAVTTPIVIATVA